VSFSTTSKRSSSKLVPVSTTAILSSETRDVAALRISLPSQWRKRGGRSRKTSSSMPLLQFLGSFSSYDAPWRQRRISPRQNASNLKLQQRRTQQLDNMKGFPGPKSWSMGSLCSLTPISSVGFCRRTAALEVLFGRRLSRRNSG